MRNTIASRLRFAWVMVGIGVISAPCLAGDVADRHYEDGHAALNSAWDLEAQAVRSGYSSSAKLRYRELAADAYEKALESFSAAVAADPNHYRAHSISGLVLRKLGRHEEALASYARALAINADDLTTVEYRAEAFVELGRFEEAKQAYYDLVKANQDLANDLLAHMEMWLERPDPVYRSLLETAEYAELRAWLDETRGIAEKVGMLSGAHSQPRQ